MPEFDASDLSKLSFLVIEDDRFAQSLATGLLEQMGAGRVHVADDGLEGLALVEDPGRPVDVLLVDLGMPDMGGVEMMRYLAERDFPGAIVLVSGAASETLAVAQELAKTRGLRVLGSISKPLTRQALNDVLGRTE